MKVEVDVLGFPFLTGFTVSGGDISKAAVKKKRVLSDSIQS